MTDLIKLPKCIVSLKGAQFDPGLTFNEWTDVGSKALKVSEAIQWVIGDWINYGEERFRDSRGSKTQYQIVMEALGERYSYPSLRQFAWVSRHVCLSSRLDNLSFRHHEVVAPLEPKLQAQFLHQAVELKLSAAGLRALVRQSEADQVEEAKKVDSSPVEEATRLNLFFARQDIGAWPRPVRDSWKQHLRPLVEIYNRL